MKSIKLVLTVVLVVLFNFYAKANNNPINEEKGKIVSKAVQKLLKEPSFLLEKDFTITVKLIVNKENEISVLSVKTDFNEEVVGNYIKKRLNKKKLNGKIDSAVYVIPVRMIKI